MLECKICNKEIKNRAVLVRHIKNHNMSAEDYYIKYINPDSITLCTVCNKKTNFLGLGKGFSITCSRSCNMKNPDTIKKRKENFITKYGVDNPSKSNTIKEKKKETCLKNYGVEHYLKDKNNMEKIKQTNLEKYGAVSALHSTEGIKKKKETWINKYGVDNPLKSKDIQDKIKETNLKRYGNICPSNGSKDIDGILKKEKTNIIKYNDNHIFGKKSSIRKNIDDKIKINYYNNLFIKYNNIAIPLFTLEEYIGVDTPNKYKWKCITCSDIFYDHIDNGTIPRCLKCNPILAGTSKYEKEIQEFLDQHNLIYSMNDRSVISPLELDFYFPNNNLAIEFNGLYWHGESMGKDKNYHLNKTKECKSKNIQLLHIFEDEWINKKDIVKSMILNKLGLTKIKYDARKCEIKNISTKDEQLFLNNNHIQGYVRSSIRIGLYFKDELVSLLTLGKPRYNKNYDYEILRFCNKTDIIVRGSFSKLLNHFIKTYNTKSIITYADKRYSNGNTYSKSFKLINESSPNYYYIDYTNILRESRIKFQKHKLEFLLESYNKDLTEWENMQINNYDRVWDCGNLVFEYV